MDVVMTNEKSNDSYLTKFKNMMDCYHYIDEMSCREEKKVDLRNAVYFRLYKLRKKVPFETQVMVATWMHDVVEWRNSRDFL